MRCLCVYRSAGLDRLVIHAIESMVIEWTHQIRDVLKKDSAQPLLEGLNPTPFVEIEFWKNKASNLECIYEQVYLMYINLYLLTAIICTPKLAHLGIELHKCDICKQLILDLKVWSAVTLQTVWTQIRLKQQKLFIWLDVSVNK